MKFTVQIDGDLNALMAREYRAGERAVSNTIKAAAEALKANWRQQITGSGLGTKLANAVRSEAYPKGAPSLNAAAIVYSKAPKITAAHEAGATIRSNSGFWLAIPLPSAGKGARGAKITPGEWETKTGRRLRFVYRSGRSALLVDDGTKTGRRLMGRDGFSREARGFRNRTVPIFALVPQVKLPKRLNLYPAADRVASGLPGAIVANWRE